MEKQVINFKNPFRILWGKYGIVVNVKAVYVYSDGTIGNFIDTDGNEHEKLRYEPFPIDEKNIEKTYRAIISALIEEKNENK